MYTPLIEKLEEVYGKDGARERIHAYREEHGCNTPDALWALVEELKEKPIATKKAEQP